MKFSITLTVLVCFSLVILVGRNNDQAQATVLSGLEQSAQLLLGALLAALFQSIDTGGGVAMLDMNMADMLTMLG